MNEAIVIATSPGRQDYLTSILESISRPTLVISDFGFELGKIKSVFDNTNLDRFIFLQDSLVIRNELMFDLLFNCEGSACFMDDPDHFGSYLGLYERKILSKIDIPIINTKEDSIRFEIEWTQQYLRAAENVTHPLEIYHHEIQTIRRFGRENKVYINQYYEKWKGDWGQSLNIEQANIDRIMNNQIIDIHRNLVIEKNEVYKLRENVKKLDQEKQTLIELLSQTLIKRRKFREKLARFVKAFLSSRF